MSRARILTGSILGMVMLSVIGAYAVYDNFRQVTENSVVQASAGVSDPPDTDEPFMLGQYYFNHDDDPGGPYDLEKAKAYYLTAVDEDPRADEIVWYQLGRIDFIQGRYASALHNFNKQIEYFGEDIPNVYYMLGLTYGYRASEFGNPEDWKRAEGAFTHFMDIYYTDWAARVDLSWIYFAQGKYEEMMAPLEEALEAHPENPWVHNMYGLALLNTGDRDGAREHFLSARTYAAELTTEDWGDAYPGNDPANWGRGLTEFREVIEKNITLVNGPE